MPAKIYPTYHQIHNDVIEYADIIKDNNVNYDVIIALARGGTLIGTILSHALNVPLIVVHYSSVSGQGESKHASSNGLPDLKKYKHVLIVDDICDTGHTFDEVFQYYDDRHYIVNTYAVYYRNIQESVHTPNYSIELMDDAWVVFPWEESIQLPFTQPFDVEPDNIWV